jgi:hypothetical protein
LEESVENRGAWVFAGLGLAFIALLMLWMGKTLDTKAPVRIERRAPAAAPPVETRAPLDERAQDEAEMNLLVSRLSGTLATRAAAQAYPRDDAAQARCTYRGARLVHRDGDTAFWDAEFLCVDSRQPEALPNPTNVSVRLRKTGPRWAVEE